MHTPHDPRPAGRRQPGTAALVAALALLPACLAACADDAGGRPGPDAEAASWTLEPELRIGSLEGPDALSRVGDVAVGPDGRLFVSLPGESRVALFGPDGAPAGSVGREGEGPGEFLSPSALGFLGDTLWVLDGRQRRISFFGAAGEHLGEERLPEVAGLDERERTSFGTLLPGGRALVVTSAGFGSEWEGTGHPFPLVTVPREGGPPDTLATRWAAHDRSALVTMAGGEIASIEIFQPVFSDATLWATSPDGRTVAVVDRPAAGGPGPAVYRLARMGIDGDTAFAVEVSYEPRAVEPARVDSLLSRYTRGGRSEAEIREVLFLPDFLPPVSDVLAADDGTVWIAREDRPGEPVAWEVFDGDGALVARTETPPGFTAYRATADALLGVETDELDVPYVVRYRAVR